MISKGFIQYFLIKIFMWLDSVKVLSNVKKRLSIKHERYTKISSDLTTFPDDFALDIWHLSNKTFIFKFKDYIYGILIKDGRYNGEAEVYYAWNPTKKAIKNGDQIAKDFTFNSYFNNQTDKTLTYSLVSFCKNVVLPNAYFRYNYDDNATIKFVPPFLIPLAGQHAITGDSIQYRYEIHIYCHDGDRSIEYEWGSTSLGKSEKSNELLNAKFCFFLPVAPYKPKDGKIEIYTIQ